MPSAEWFTRSKPPAYFLLIARLLLDDPVLTSRWQWEYCSLPD
jgi:hypothetical protein